MGKCVVFGVLVGIVALGVKFYNKSRHDQRKPEWLSAGEMNVQKELLRVVSIAGLVLLAIMALASEAHAGVCTAQTGPPQYIACIYPTENTWNQSQGTDLVSGQSVARRDWGVSLKLFNIQFTQDQETWTWRFLDPNGLTQLQATLSYTPINPIMPPYEMNLCQTGPHISSRCDFYRGSSFNYFNVPFNLNCFYPAWGTPYPITISHQLPGSPEMEIGRVTYVLFDDPSFSCVRPPTSSGNPSARPATAPDAPQDPDPRPPEPTAACMPGKPVEVTTGNVFFDHTDIILPGRGRGVRLTRSYNSLNPSAGGVFGRGWTYAYEKALTFPSPGVIALQEGDGVPVIFQDPTGSGTYNAMGPYSQAHWIVRTARPDPFDGFGQYVYTRYFRLGGHETYEDWGRLREIIDPLGQALFLIQGGGSIDALVFQYTGGHVTSVSGPGLDSLIATYTYTGDLLTTVTYRDGSGYKYDYDNNNRLKTVSDLNTPPTVLETHTYYPDGRAWTSAISGNQEKLTFTYGTNQTTVTDSRNNITTYDWATYSGVNRVTRISGSLTCGSGAELQEWTYDASGRVLSYKTGGDQTTYDYDPVTGQLSLEVTPAPESARTTYDYFSDGRIKTKTDPLLAKTSYTYATGGPLTVTEDVAGTETRTTTMTYYPLTDSDNFDRVKTIKDPRGKTTTLQYRAQLLTSVTDPRGKIWAFEYDTLRRRTSITDPLMNKTQFSYDADKVHLGSIIYADLTHTDFTYDKGGRRTSVTDPLNHVTEYGYDTYGHLQTVTTRPSPGGPQSSVTMYGYDAMSNLQTIQDARNKVTNFDYDGNNRVKTITYPGPTPAPFESFCYDTAGRLQTRTDRKGVVTTYLYESGRLKRKTYSDATPAVGYTYWPTGRLKTADNGSDLLGWTYDLAGQLSFETSRANSSRIDYTYWPDGSRQYVVINNVVYLFSDYDDAGRRSYTLSYDVPTSSWKTYGFGYDDANRRTYVAYPNSVVTSYTYDTLSRLTLAYTYDSVPTPPTALAYAQYPPSTGYDAAGNRKVKNTESYSELYDYDPLYRLKTVTRNNVLSEQYGYDGVGNRTSALGNPATWNYDDRNQLRNNGVATFDYDQNGNLKSRIDASGTWTFEWNAENQLTRVLQGPAVVAQFAYDPLGRRISKTAGVTVYNYLYDGQDILQETVGPSVVRFVHGPGVDEHLAVEVPGGASYYYHTDALGSVVLVTDVNRTPLVRYSYDSFGQIQGGGAPNGYAFTGREWDPETSLYYYRARYYDAKLGRFLSEDPIGYVDGPNLYPYVLNNPTNFRDPFGLQWDSVSRSLQAALRNGDAGEIRAILETAGDVLPAETRAAAQEAVKQLGTPARDLVTATLKRSPSYASELEGKTLEQLLRDPNPSAKVKAMIKLIKQAGRLTEKLKQCGR